MGFFQATKGSDSDEAAFDDKQVSQNQYGRGHDGDRRHSAIAMEQDPTLAALDVAQDEDPHHPRHWPSWKRWSLAVIYCFLQVFVTITSTSYVSAEYYIGEHFNETNTQVITLGQSMFILGNAIGPIFLGPLADVSWVECRSMEDY